MNALTEDQKTIEGILEGERVRMEESFKSATAARKARDEKHAEEDAVEERCGKTTDDTCRLRMNRQRCPRSSPYMQPISNLAAWQVLGQCSCH